MASYEQGSLDGLCGVYSIINASRIINTFNDEKCGRLFKEVIEFLNYKHSLAELLINGLDINLIGQIMNNVKSLEIKKEQPYRGKSEITLGKLWTSMQAFLREPNRAILLGLGGANDHWTVVESISDKQMKLADSLGLKRLNRSSCTTSERHKQRRNLICPSYTYFLYSANE